MYRRKSYLVDGNEGGKVYQLYESSTFFHKKTSLILNFYYKEAACPAVWEPFRKS